jgi:crotonobetainyl-CoA:carnitine CoA-transferase CaiB-like acyl-CoA transferase
MTTEDRTPSADGPLAGLRVVELTHIVAGPSAGFIFAELGADTIRVEPPSGGDQLRSGDNPVFPFLNRNKRSLAVDLKSAGGLEIFRRLIETADVLVDNFAPGTLDRLGLTFDELSEMNPRLIHLSVKGFLPGPYEARPSLDELAQMMGGLAFMTGPRGMPLRAGASVTDIGSAAYGVLGVLAALIQREKTGRGQKVTTGLFETIVFWVGQTMAQAAVSGEPSVSFPDRPQSSRMGWGVYHLFTTSDEDEIFIGVTSNAHWRRFCEALELDDLASDSSLTNNEDRALARDWLIPRLRTEISRFGSTELQGLLDTAGVPFAPLRRPDQLLDDAHLLASGQLVDTPIPGHGSPKLPRLPFASSEYATGLRIGAPGRGEQTQEILTELGYSAQDVAAFASDGVVLVGGALDQEWTSAVTGQQ